MGAEAAGSRRMVARGWRALSSDEEARTYLQERLELLSKLMFWSFITLVAFMSLLYWVYPDVKPDHQNQIVYMSAGGILLLAGFWRVLRVRRGLTLRQLNGIDLFYSIGTGLVFGASAYLAMDFPPSAYACLLYCSFMVLLRTIVVPSTGRRTALTSVILFLPMFVASVLVSVKWPQQQLKPPAYVSGAMIIGGVVIALATIGSTTIYGLRQKVSAAMQLGSYTLGQKIGEGGMGAVYRARHTLLRRPTAIKLLLPDRIDADTLERFEREVQHTSQLTHPNTVAVYDYGRSPSGMFYYAMEYLDGINLEQLVGRFGPQPVDRIVSILTQVCGALHEAHASGIMHRDIKPANIILCERGAVPDVAKVVDFGLVKEIAGDNGNSTKVIFGTPAYLAPEAVTDPDKVGPPADLYALGAVGYFLLTGRRVFEGKTFVDVCIQHASATPVPPSKVSALPVPPELERLLMRCLSKLAADRPSAAELARLLRDVPPAADWTDDQVHRWWEEFRVEGEPSGNFPVEPITITVDLGARIETPEPRRRRASSSVSGSIGR